MKKIGLVIVFLWLLPICIMGQERSVTETPKIMTIKGSVKEEKTLKPIKDVEVQISGQGMVKTDAFGDFKIRARVGDELIVRHDSFKTVFYTIENNERIDVKVKENPAKSKSKFSRKQNSSVVYNENLNAARNSLKSDASTSIGYITNALETIRDDDPDSDNKKAVLFETLADIYGYWKQPDLAESNYSVSLSHKYNTDVKIKLGNSQLEDNNYQGALNTFIELKKRRLNTAQKIKVFSGLGDSYKGLNDYNNATSNYNKALSLSQKRKMEDDEILLNSKLAEVLEQQGNFGDAEQRLDNSVQLANRRDKKSAARQRSKAADFYNKNNSYDKEIQLRKEALEDIEEIDIVNDSISLDDKALNAQVQNYKIASAFAAQSEYDEAIPYLKESIKEAESKNDLVIQKDATRKLGEVYREKGELKKASEAFKEYEVIVDKLYVQKEQEISQTARFSRELALRANRITTLEKDRELNEAKYQLAFAEQEISKQRSLQQQVIIYALIGVMALLLLAAYLMYRNMRQQRYANNLLALKSLRSQMNPHFIFNALNSVNAFIATNDERTANRYLTDFSLLMRAVLENSEEDFIPLEKEIELLELYVKLEHFRFLDKFDYTIEVDDNININEYMIPPMLLQPYVENAVWHGLRYKSEKGRLTISFKKLTTDSMQIMIEDNGIGRKKSKELKTVNQKLQKSKGMSNIKKRITILNEMYKDKVDVFISDLENEDGGTQVSLTLKKDR
ncbi:histidine kinase [Aquimarina sp. 2201CG5-10]|uniref:tetratricopeptide repeat-containing sensor histidine kinase n=1 Tax=Aquimarina callyspongiae TaxID=3098150 RepID=UPI002AB47A0D|nr:histidine kinase [Aquimarina sp. 2201CG5-10]MDY8136674.1 histidine kinase [Aquimarina sp. 2201CG5-10]